ncbi:MAG: hypothetical protein IKG18_07595 [Atopobiaceae bacterium]|nr:hypothetical protein [Atopobiaceae bacterium]
MNDARSRVLENLRGSFRYAWLLLGIADVVLGLLGTFRFIENSDLNQGSVQLAILCIVTLTSIVAFFSGSQFEAGKNKEKLDDDAQALIKTYKAAADKIEQSSKDRIQSLEHKIGELTTQLEAEKTRAARVNELERGLAKAEQDAKGSKERAAELGDKVRDLEDELSRLREDEERRFSEQREHVIRAHNLISQLNQPEAKALRSLINGNNQLMMTDSGTTGLLSLGAIAFLADTGSYIPGRGKLGYYSVNPVWRTYTSWERKLLNEIAVGNGDEAKRRADAISGVRDAVGLGLVVQSDGLYMPDETGTYKRIASQDEMVGSEAETERREVFDSLNDREKWCLAHIMTVSPKKFSISGSLLIPSYEVLARAGVVIELETEVVNGEKRHVYAVNPKWRSWVSSHVDELPDPKSPLPA